MSRRSPPHLTFSDGLVDRAELRDVLIRCRDRLIGSTAATEVPEQCNAVLAAISDLAGLLNTIPLPPPESGRGAAMAAMECRLRVIELTLRSEHDGPIRHARDDLISALEDLTEALTGLRSFLPKESFNRTARGG